ncbi:MAG: PAS domain-containing protein, partial [Pseudomonadota bacterium]
MARKAATRNSARTSSARAKSTRGARISVPGSDAGFRLLFENSPLSMWVYDRDSFRFLAVNDAAVRRYGYSRAEFLAMDIFAIRPPHEVARLKQV